MTDLDPAERFRQELHDQVQQEATERIKAYIARHTLHVCAAGFDNGDDLNEGKN